MIQMHLKNEKKNIKKLKKNIYKSKYLKNQNTKLKKKMKRHRNVLEGRWVGCVCRAVGRREEW